MMLRNALFVIALCALGFSGETTSYDRVYSNTPASKAKVDKMISGLDLEYFVNSISLDWLDVGFCNKASLPIPGFATCYSEPALIGDYSLEPMEIHTLGITFGTDPMKNGYSRSDKNDGASHNFGYANLVGFPILGMVEGESGFCFDQGGLKLSYTAWLDPTYDGMFSSTVFPDVTAMFNPVAMVVGALDCAAASVATGVDPFGTIAEYNNKIRMGLNYYAGCWNSFPMGGWAHDPNTIVNAGTGVTYGLAMGQRAGIIRKTKRLEGMDGSLYRDSMCGGEVEPLLVKVGYDFGLFYPTPGEVVPLGAAAPEFAEFKQDGTSSDKTAFWVYKHKCFYYGAAPCSQKRDKK